MKILNLAAIALRQKDIQLIAVFALVLLMMILPLPSLLMDVFITLNISASIIIILMALQLHQPVQFSTFPSLLLVTTLFRLAISISTTRLILIEGSAGKIVETFGNVVVGGNLVVGLVIFLIITVVQFLVITKGADRVAEVGARFTLDGMPGKQMSVDADVRAGNIDQFDAKQARQTLEREAKLFGAMDGAMKFVKGDATAGLVITAINLLGGIGIGMAQRGLPFGEALELYALMTVGDGLVSQIPALLISVAAGTMVTRVTNPDGMDLGTEINQQISQNGRTMVIAGAFIALFGFIPGFPTIIFLGVGGGLGGGIYMALRRQVRDRNLAETDWARMQEVMAQEVAMLEARTGVQESVRLVLPQDIVQLDPRYFRSLFNNVRNSVEKEFGVPVGLWKFEVASRPSTEYTIYVKQEKVAVGLFQPNMLFVKANSSYLTALDIAHETEFGTREGTLVPADQKPFLEQNHIPFWAAHEQLFMHLKKTVIENLEKIFGLQATSELLENVSKSNAVVVTDLKEALSINQICAVFRLLLRERIPVTNRITILEAILEWSQQKSEPNYLAQKTRIAMADFMTQRFAPNGFVSVVVVAPSLETSMREGLRNTDEGNFLVLEPSISANIAQQVKKIVGDGYKRGQHQVLLIQQDVRMALFTILSEHGIFIPVLAYQELMPETIIYPVGYLAADPEADDIY